jgi:sulfotransferase family protein
MRKKILVVSHERSGTHFLINTIMQSFGGLLGWIDLDEKHGVNWRHPQMARDWLAQFKGQSVPAVFKSHHAFPLLAPVVAQELGEFFVFYVQRDGRDVMTSFWMYLNRLEADWGPKTATVGEFMRAPARGSITQYQTSDAPITMLQRWVDHVAGWSRADFPVHRVSYESLHEQHGKVVDRIATILGEQPISRVRPALDAPSILPWRGKVGTWRDFFTAADSDYFERNTKGLRA